jgi:3-oxoacyl-[acyl-carrier protein] reductase
VQKTHVLITGANRGIGNAVAKRCHAAGYFVIATARKLEDVAKLKDEGFYTLTLDVTNDASIENFFSQLKIDEKSIDVLVNNAGISHVSLFSKTSYASWDSIISTNLTSIFKISKKVINSMSRKGFGRIINISSVLSIMPQKGFTAYSASKAGIEGITRGLALEYAPKGITVNCIAPGFVDTDMLNGLGDKGKEMMESSIPVGYAAKPDDIAALVLFLASPEARYITGETIHINGGLYFS